MTKWQRFGDSTWVNVDQVEILRIEEQQDGRWQLTADFASGRSYPVGSHEDGQLLADCTDALMRGEMSDRLRAWASETDEAPSNDTMHGQTEPVKAKRWRLKRPRRERAHGAVGQRAAASPS